MSISKRQFQSAGQLSEHIIPGAYSRIDSVKGAGGLVSANNLVIIGESTGGKPTTLLQFNKRTDAINTFKTGSLMEAMRLSFAPGNGIVPQKIFGMRLNSAVQSSYTLVDGSANDMIKLRSRDYGLQMNQLNILFGAGTNNGKKLTVNFKTITNTYDDLYQASMEVTHASATATIVNNTGTQTLTLSVGSIVLDLNEFLTIGDLVVRINAESGYTAVLTAGQEDASSLELDAISAVSLVGGLTIESTMQAIIDTVNASSVYLEAIDLSAANDNAIPENVTPAAFLTGGSEGSAGTTEWTAALLALEAENIQYIATPDTTGANHALIKAHCEAMSAVTGRKERQFGVGNIWGEVKATAITNAIAINSKYGMQVFNGGTQFNVNGVLTNFHSGYAACMLLSMKTALAINAPLTFKELNFISLEAKIIDSDIEQLLENGVAVVAHNQNEVPHLVRQLNTYQTDDLKWNEFSMVSIMNYVSRDLRNFLESRYVGRASTTFSLTSLQGQVVGRLALYDSLGLFISDGEKSYWNVLLSLTGDTVAVDYDAYVTAPINFIFITNHFHEVSASI